MIEHFSAMYIPWLCVPFACALRKLYNLVLMIFLRVISETYSIRQKNLAKKRIGNINFSLPLFCLKCEFYASFSDSFEIFLNIQSLLRSKVLRRHFEHNEAFFFQVLFYLGWVKNVSKISKLVKMISPVSRLHSKKLPLKF